MQLPAAFWTHPPELLHFDRWGRRCQHRTFRIPYTSSTATVTMASATATPPKPSARPNQPAPSLWSIPAPLQKLFNQFPLVTLDPNPLPARSQTLTSASDTLPTLYIFSSDEDALEGKPSINPTCLKWQVSGPVPLLPFLSIPQLTPLPQPSDPPPPLPRPLSNLPLLKPRLSHRLPPLPPPAPNCLSQPDPLNLHPPLHLPPHQLPLPPPHLPPFGSLPLPPNPPPPSLPPNSLPHPCLHPPPQKILHRPINPLLSPRNNPPNPTISRSLLRSVARSGFAQPDRNRRHRL